jgi:hypothetical protein
MTVDDDSEQSSEKRPNRLAEVMKDDLSLTGVAFAAGGSVTALLALAWTSAADPDAVFVLKTMLFLAGLLMAGLGALCEIDRRRRIAHADRASFARQSEARFADPDHGSKSHDGSV